MGFFARLIANDFATAYQTWTRGAISVLILAIVGLIVHSFKKIQKKDIKWFIIYTLGGALVIVPFILAVVNVPLGTALFLFYSVNTIFCFIYGKLFFKEKLNTTKIISISLALIGMIFLYYGSMGLSKPIFIFYAILSGFFYSLYSSFNKKLSNNYSVVQIAFSNQLMVMILNLILFIFLKEKANTNFISISWALNLLFALFLTSTTMLIVYGFKRVEIQKGSLTLLSELVFVLLLGFLFYKEILTPTSALGSLLITTALILPNLKISSLFKN